MIEEHPEGWASTNIGSCVDILDGMRVPVNANERAKRRGQIPYYGATGQVGWIDDYLFDEPLVLIGEDGAPFFDKSKPIAYLIHGKSWVNNHAHVLRARKGLTTNEFIKHALDAIDFHDYVNGTTRLKLTKGALSTIPVLLPPLEEQRRIVATLEALRVEGESCRSHLERSRKALERASRVTISAASSVGEPVSLGEVLESVTYGTAKKCGPNVAGTPVLRIPNIAKGFIDQSDLKFAKLDRHERDRLALRRGDLLMVRSNGSVSLVGRSALVSDKQAGLAFAGYLLRLRCDLRRALPSYVNLALRSGDVRAQIEMPARSTSGVHNINSEEVRKLRINLPSLDEQHQVVQRVEGLLAAIGALESRVARATSLAGRLTHSISAKAFRGELVPTEAELARKEHRGYEPASTLLERKV